MPTIETIEAFIEAVEAGAHDKVIEKYYTENASIQENQMEPRRGRNNLVENEKKVMARAKTVISKCVRPFFVQQDIVVIRWYFKFEWKDDTITEINEMAYQVWEGERISKEQFFYDPKQFVPIKKVER